MRVYILAIIALLFASSCKNMAYNRVATDTHRSERNKKLLLGECEKQFPQEPPTYKPGKETIRIDTVLVPYQDTALKEILKPLAGKLNIDSLTDIIKKSIPPQYIKITKERVDTTEKNMSGYKIELLQQQLREEQKAHDKLQNQYDQLSKDNDDLKSKMHHLRFIQWMGWIIAISELLLWGFFKFYVKKFLYNG